MIRPTEQKLRRSDFQFSILRLLVVTMTACVVLAFVPQGILGMPIWPSVLLFAFLALVIDVSSYAMLKGQQAIQQGDLAGAIEQFSWAIKAKPDEETRYYARGTTYLISGDTASALLDLTRAIQIEPDYWEAYIARGWVHLHEENPSDALRDFRVVMELTPENLDAVYGRSCAKFRLGDYAAAFCDIKTCLDDDPCCLDWLCVLSWFLATCPAESFRDGQRALETAQRASALDLQQDWSSEASLSAAYAELGRFDEAVKHGESALELAPPVMQEQLEARLATVASRQPLRDACQTN